jgi:hypothetical protein
MRGRTTAAVAVATLIIGCVTAFGPGTAVAKSGGQPVTFSGSITCAVTGKLAFNPPLAGIDSGTSKATITATLSGCRHGAEHKIKVTGGQLKGLIGFVTPDNCTNLAIDNTPPLLAGGTVSWSPKTEVAPSTGISFPDGSAQVVSIDGVTYLDVGYFSGGGSGSFANAGDSFISVVTTQNDAQLEAKCTSAKGLASVTFRGVTSL